MFWYGLGLVDPKSPHLVKPYGVHSPTPKLHVCAESIRTALPALLFVLRRARELDTNVLRSGGNPARRIDTPHRTWRWAALRADERRFAGRTRRPRDPRVRVLGALSLRRARAARRRCHACLDLRRPVRQTAGAAKARLRCRGRGSPVSGGTLTEPRLATRSRGRRA